ncbi:hypothetical protein H6P81_016038 [Aristolochia fimbriata]|uniref:Uncharacterized protein n=1 Tax=Aristolochia fimbriata TaxID=158543 RepID=A0AAV7E787_ARIFI|nr:hypothetical protein H6P81_016038 [Aristolochia fimbriata]
MGRNGINGKPCGPEGQSDGGQGGTATMLGMSRRELGVFLMSERGNARRKGACVLRAVEAGGISLGLLPPCVLRKGLSPLCAPRKGLLPPERSVQWLAAQRGKALEARTTLFPNSSILIFHALVGPFGAPTPDLDLPQTGAYGAFAGSPCMGRDLGRADRGTCEWCTLDLREQCFRPYMPSSRRAVFPSLHGPPAALLGRWHPPGACVFLPRTEQLALMYSPFETHHRTGVVRVRGGAQSGVRVYFPPRHSLTPGVLGTPDA